MFSEAFHLVPAGSSFQVTNGEQGCSYQATLHSVLLQLVDNTSNLAICTPL